jgi:hypothetical protein
MTIVTATLWILRQSLAPKGQKLSFGPVIPNARVFHRGGGISVTTVVERQPMQAAQSEAEASRVSIASLLTPD